ncbi:unnamed protein product [Didymodactylos carnosus]|uniref:Beta-catenin-interacting ICAT domain-containing protein n=1 Tax=Didymodactylos carnosus TaxID=1234261 RepID=A0A813QFT6_9BILA|nr:unnamed protein product [Didymodactylos carnosus]CAF0859004.1 unnamed protein product [Didymodactylos carnosus]CAF3547946.1 unnamed protein product [Didymodactylos carnosus]CAF3643993.1 unnamed protein product [Didymodactylos carnosus]
MSSKSHFLQEMAYPPYSIVPLNSWGLIAVGGGGGTAKTGVANAVDLKWIFLDGIEQPAIGSDVKCSLQNVNSFTQHDSVMRMVSLRKQREYLILALNRQLKVIMLKASYRKNESPPPPSSSSSINATASTLSSSTSSSTPTNAQVIHEHYRYRSNSVRKRKNSSSSSVDQTIATINRPNIVFSNGQATVDAFGNDFMMPSSVPSSPASTTQSFVLPTSNSSMIPPTSSVSVSSIQTSNIYTVEGLHDQEYVNALAICPYTQSKLFVGASDGSLMIYDIIWPPLSGACDRLLQLRLISSFRAHTKEIDDLAIDYSGNYLISVSRDHHVYVRQCQAPFDKLNELDLKQFGSVTARNRKISTTTATTTSNATARRQSQDMSKSVCRYRIRHVRFGIKSPTNNLDCYLYTSVVPQSVNDKLKSFICQWSCKDNDKEKTGKFYTVKRRSVSYERISAMALSNDGLFISIGDSGGYVRIYNTQYFQLLHEQHSHAIFVTDLTFILKNENYLYETSVLSISADKNLYLHNVHKQQLTNLLSIPSACLIGGLLLLFILLSQIRFVFQLFYIIMSNQTDILRNNLHTQLDRLLEQLEDLEKFKDEMSNDEYEDAKKDTRDQLEEFGKSLEKMKKGDLTFINDIQRIQSAIQAAISQAFQTPEVIRFFAKKQPVQLRNRLSEIERDIKIGRLNSVDGSKQKKEILEALKKLGEVLTNDEDNYLRQYSQGGDARFAKMGDSTDVSENVISAAAKQIEQARR